MNMSKKSQIVMIDKEGKRVQAPSFSDCTTEIVRQWWKQEAVETIAWFIDHSLGLTELERKGEVKLSDNAFAKMVASDTRLAAYKNAFIALAEKDINNDVLYPDLVRMQKVMWLVTGKQSNPVTKLISDEIEERIRFYRKQCKLVDL